MSSQLTTYITLICTSGVLSLYLCFYVFVKRYHYSSVANFFMLYTASVSIYCFAAAMGLLATTLPQMKFWTIIQYIGMPISSPLGLLVIMQYLGIKITKKRCGALLLIPILSFIMVATNDWHHMHYRVFEADPLLGAPFIYMEIGIWYVIHGVFRFACMLVACLLVISHWKETATAYHPQLAALIFGQLVPMLTSFLYLVGLTPPGIDPVPMVLWLSSLLYLWAISSSRLFTLMPIAKDTIFNSIDDGVFVLDESYRLIEFNQAGKQNFPRLNKSMFGMDFNQVWMELAGEPFPLALNIAVNKQEVQLTAGDSACIYRVRTASLAQGWNSGGLLIIFTDITELKRLHEVLERQAYYDELTQIYNRRAFLQQCERDYTAARKNSSPFSVMLMDIDHFKRVNDTYGHHAGDQLLVHIVNVCQSQLKEGQFFARYGGEEFVLALNGQTAIEAEALGNRICSSLENQPLVTAKGTVSVTLSMGVAEAVIGEATGSLYQLLNKADKALYSAKQQGRNQVQIFTADEKKYIEKVN